jgi:hypothetical protein
MTNENEPNLRAAVFVNLVARIVQDNDETPTTMSTKKPTDRYPSLRTVEVPGMNGLLDPQRPVGGPVEAMDAG